MYLNRAKTKLLEHISKAGLPYAVEKIDIVKLVGEAWDKSFSHIDSNKKVVAEHGWGP
jgi:hypothetical protein